MRNSIYTLLLLFFAVNCIAQNNFPSSGNVGINLAGVTSLNKLQIGPNPQGWSGNDLVISNGNGAMAIFTDPTHTYLYGTKDIAIRPGYGVFSVYAKYTGDVGIRSTNPQGTLQIGDYRPVIIKSNGGNGVYGSELGFNAVLNTSVVPNKLRKLGGTGQYGGASIAVDYSGNMLFQMYNANAESESIINYAPQIAFLNSGRVGIGTLSPDAALAVKGTIHSNEVKVDLLGAVAPDYVFEKDYPLTSLTELKTYIDQNKHLPEVPSAKEMEENGINLKEMNLLLLKKIEELTLYMLKQHETNQSLKLELQELRGIINNIKTDHK